MNVAVLRIKFGGLHTGRSVLVILVEIHIWDSSDSALVSAQLHSYDNRYTCITIVRFKKLLVCSLVKSKLNSHSCCKESTTSWLSCSRNIHSADASATQETNMQFAVCKRLSILKLKSEFWWNNAYTTESCQYSSEQFLRI